MHFARLANTLLKDEEIARDNHVLACNFAKYSLILFCCMLHASSVTCLRLVYVGVNGELLYGNYCKKT